MSQYQVHISHNERLKKMFASIKKDGNILKELVMDVHQWASDKLIQKLLVKRCNEFIERDKHSGSQSEGNQ